MNSSLALPEAMAEPPRQIAYFRRSSKSGFSSLSPATCHHLNRLTGVPSQEAPQQQLQQHPPPPHRREQAVLGISVSGYGCVRNYVAM